MKRETKDLDIGEVAKRSGLSVATLRFYEEKGLITSSGRRGLRRSFSSKVIERLALVALGRAAGFSLDELGSMIKQGSPTSVTKERLASKAAQLDLLIRQLTATRDGLRHALACKAPDFMECPHFRRVLSAAAAHRVQPLPVNMSQVEMRGKVTAPRLAAVKRPVAAKSRAAARKYSPKKTKQRGGPG